MSGSGAGTPLSSAPSPEEEFDLDPGTPNASQPQTNAQLTSDSKNGSPTITTPINETNAKAQSQVPLQKRRRVTRACDECRRKKIKCDGKQPCTHCTVYSYECTYDQPSHRRRNPAPQYIEALEQRLQKSEAIIRSLLPNIDLDDPKFDARGVDQIIEATKTTTNPQKPPEESKPDDDSQIQSMVNRTGLLDLDDEGNWDFHGHSSGYAFMRRIRAQFGEPVWLPNPRASSIKNRSISQVLDSPKSANSSPVDTNFTASSLDLPRLEVAIELCRNTLDDCCALMRPLHRPSFFRRLHMIYDTDPEQYTNDHVKFLPLLYVVMAVGCLFSKSEHENTMLDVKGYKEAIEQGYQYFNAGKQMLEITDCRDLLTLQAILFMILFLQSSAKLATCYSYLGIALRACCRLGLHRNLPNNFNAIEKEERKRIFWITRKMDTYVGALLGLPQLLSEEDIDQEFPSEVNDEFITEEGIQPMPVGSFPLLKASNAHTRLMTLLRKVVRYIYPIKGPGGVQATGGYSVSHGRIRELERDLQSWMDDLPMELRPSDNAGMELSRVQQLLRMSYAHVQMMMYRPFIHYVSQASQTGKADKRSFACAAACVSVARNIVHITSEMKRRGLLVGAYWFVMYTTYFAILSLIFFVLENPDTPTSKDILKDAMEGRDTLAGLAKRSLAADRCTMSLTELFKGLPEKLKERRMSMHNPPTSSKKRPPPEREPMQFQVNRSNPNIANTSITWDSQTKSNRARTLPHDYMEKMAKRNSMPEAPSTLNLADRIAPNPQLMGFNSPVISSPMSGQFDFNTQTNAAQIPDLKTVMFPSDNPFAYPNQPISTLESGETSFGFQDPGLESFSGSAENSMFGTPSHMDTPIQPRQNGQEFDISNFHYNEEPAAHQFLQQGRTYSVPMSGMGYPHAMNEHNSMFDMTDVQESSNGGNGTGAVASDNYWNPMAKGNPGLRAGFNPSAGVNLDELFGSDGWGGMWSEQEFPR